MLFFLLACAAPPPPPDAEALLVAADAGGVRVSRELVLEVGTLVDGAWSPREADGIELPAQAELPWGRSSWTVRRPCGPVTVPLRVGPGAQVVVPVPACVPPDAPALPGGVRLDRRERPWSELSVLVGLGVLEGVPEAEPGEEATPARFVTLDEADAACAFWGGRLPTEAEWAAAGGQGRDARAAGPAAPGDPGPAPIPGPYGHEQLDGNVAEWAAAPADAARSAALGGSWLRAERARQLPRSAREEDVGFRCAYGP